MSEFGKRVPSMHVVDDQSLPDSTVRIRVKGKKSDKFDVGEEKPCEIIIQHLRACILENQDVLEEPEAQPEREPGRAGRVRSL